MKFGFLTAHLFFIMTKFDFSPIHFDFSKNVDLFDYIKGWSILFVILTHCWPRWFRSALLFNTWGQMAVPLFLLITSALYFRHGVPRSVRFNFRKLFERAIKPYLFLVAIVFVLSLIIRIQTFHSALSLLIHKGGFGPGSYYVPMFVIFSMILPLTNSFWHSRVKRCVLYCLFIGLSVLSIAYVPEEIYRILPIRYLLLIPLGFIWAQYGIKLNYLTISLSLISFIFLLLFHYSSINFYPIFWTKEPWDYANWICYFWPAFFLPFVFRYLMALNLLHTNLFFQWLGKRSFEIFLTQMTVFYFIRQINFITSHLVLYCLLSLVLSILPIYLYEKSIPGHK